MNHKTSHDVHLPTHIFGVDFSGAVDAGLKIWIATGHLPRPDKPLHITSNVRADTLPDSGVEREVALPALRRFLLSQGACAAGLDFPFSIARELITQPDWTAFAEQFAPTFPSPEAFKTTCFERGGGKELRRETDRATKTPFAPANHRLYRQTYYGIRDILAPAVAEGACVLPMQPITPGAPWLLEICPASLLKRENLYLSYKGASATQRDNRERILDETLDRGWLDEVPPDVRGAAVADTGGDALDGILAAVATARALRRMNELQAMQGSDEALEGRVYL